ncbi:unnamed protein product [Heterobilharzia americana]|nr:unnamed protein product [Heterobilharzia americana]CAH8514866.1 unnamed protein product [Heterobilharzia americana]
MPNILSTVSTSDDCSAEPRSKQKNSLLSLQNVFHICFVVIISLKLYGEYFSGVVLAFWVYLTVIFMNSETQKSFIDVSYRRTCFLYSLVSLSHLILLQYSLYNQGFYYVFLLRTSSPVSSLPLAVWCIFIWDLSLKLLLIFVKNVVLTVLTKLFDCYSMGSLLCLLENIFLLLRHIPSGVFWIYFLMEFNWQLQGVLAGRIFISVLYCILKPFAVESQAPSNEVCTMCLESYTVVAILPCGHKFCAKCTSRWCNAFTTCPSCNQEFKANSKWRDGSTDLYIQFY